MAPNLVGTVTAGFAEHANQQAVKRRFAPGSAQFENPLETSREQHSRWKRQIADGFGRVQRALQLAEAFAPIDISFVSRVVNFIERGVAVGGPQNQVDQIVSVSYTHLTLPTIYSV